MSVASEHRSRAVAREFQLEHPCPSTGLPSFPCPGYRRDHIVRLACGGPDAVENMQWQTIADARAKDPRKRAPDKVADDWFFSPRSRISHARRSSFEVGVVVLADGLRV